MSRAIRWRTAARRAVFCTALLLSACSRGADEPRGETIDEPSADGRPVTLPTVRGDAEGMLLVWIDSEGPHSASRRSDIPEAHRATVRVQPLDGDPAASISENQVFVADLRRPGPDGAYPVRVMARHAFDALIDRATGHTEPPSSGAPRAAGDDPSAPVIIYGASWCGVCRTAAAFFRREGIAFVEKDIERDSAARAEMSRKATAAGVPTSGIPVIDVGGQLMAGFDESRVRALLQRRQKRQ